MKNLRMLFLVSALLMTSVALRAQDGAAPAVSFQTFEAKLDQASPHAQILDARTKEEFALNHLKGAVQVNVSSEAELQEVVGKLDKRKPVFVYSINNGRSGVLAKKLRAAQFNEVYELPGGISKWIGAGKPVVTTTGTGLTFDDYKKQVASNKLVLVDVHSKFCGGCKKLVPIVDSVATANAGTLKVVKIELFDNKQLGKDLNIESIPTLILYNGDKIVWRQSGFTARAALDAIVKAQLQ